MLRTSDFDPVSAEAFNRQLQKAIAVVLILFALLVFRLWVLQVVGGWKYRTKSESNRIHLQDIPPFRGLISDRYGDRLVNNIPAYDLYLIPEEIHDRRALLKTLQSLVGVDVDTVEMKLAKESRYYPFRPVCVSRNISRDDLALIETHRFNLPGVMIGVSPQRHYVNAELACHLLGYLGEINDRQLQSGRFPDNRPGDLIGKSGTEKRWQHELNGVRGGEQIEVDAAGRKLNVISRKPPVSGSNLYLTIDRALQHHAEEVLSGKKGAIVALDPQDGQVLAMASSPSFDPNRFISGIDKDTWQEMVSSQDFPLQNRALSGLYPPGSVFKMVVALAGLEKGLIDPEEEIVCTGAYPLGDHVFRCWKKYGHGAVNLHRALVESCDVYFYKLGQKLGVDTIAEYARRFGLGGKTGFDLGNEQSGLVPTRSWKLKRWGIPWQTGETLSTAIGQSFVLVTPIQMARLMAAVFNGGRLYEPGVTYWVKNADGKKTFEFKAKMTRQVGVQEAHLERVKSALIDVVNGPRGTGSRARLENALVAGKTGTAQVVALDKDKTEDEDDMPEAFRDHAWFVAIAPADRPRIAVAVLVENGGHGGSAAAPLAKSVIQAYLKVPE